MNLRTPSLNFLYIITFALFVLQGCSSPSNITEDSTDNSSRLEIPDTQDKAPKDIALCNKFSVPEVTFKLMVFYDQNGYYHPEFIRLYIPQIHSEFEKSNYQLVFRKWKASLNGETQQDDTPLKIWTEKLNGKVTMTTSMDALHWETLSAELQKTLGYIPKMNDIFKAYNFVLDLKDYTGAYDVLKISLYKDGKLVQDFQWNMLLPAFYAHPAYYAENQNGVLAKLHPFYGLESSSFGNDFAVELNSNCF